MDLPHTSFKTHCLKNTWSYFIASIKALYGFRCRIPPYFAVSERSHLLKKVFFWYFYIFTSDRHSDNIFFFFSFFSVSVSKKKWEINKRPQVILAKSCKNFQESSGLYWRLSQYTAILSPIRWLPMSHLLNFHFKPDKHLNSQFLYQSIYVSLFQRRCFS